MSGEWIPLDCTSIRRGSTIKCMRQVTTEVQKFPTRFSQRGSLFISFCKVLSLDQDGDARVASLSDAGISGLLVPSKQYRVFNKSCAVFETCVPVQACSELAQFTRSARGKSLYDGDDEG